MEIVVSSKEFQTFLSAVSLIERNGVSFDIHRNYIDSIVVSEDKSSILLWSRINILEPEKTGLDENDSKNIFIKDLSKFQKLLDMNEIETFTFLVENNEIRYHGNIVKSAKFGIKKNDKKEDGARYSSKVFDSFNVSFSSEIEKKDFKRIFQAASFCDVNEVKVYFYAKDGILVGEINDRTKQGADSLVLSLSNNIDGDLKTSIVSINILSKIKYGEKMKMEGAVIPNGGIGLIFTMVEENITLKYLLASKKN